MAEKEAYTVKELADLAGVTVRTLHHYDQIDLLKPSSRSPAGYRRYASLDLMRLQQIMFYRESGLRLEKIRSILDDPDFNELSALEEHRAALHRQVGRLTKLLTTVDRTIQKITEANAMVTDKDLYEGFSDEQVARYEKEANERYDPELVRITKERLGKMSKGQWQAVQEEGEAVSQGLAGMMDRQPGDPQVQEFISRHHAWIENFYPCPGDVYRGLGQLYGENEEFRAYYEKYAPGLADFMQAAMTLYADRTLPGEWD